MTSKSELFFQRALDDKTKEAREAVQKCILEFLSPSNGNRKEAAKNALDSVDKIASMLHPNDQPQWLTNLRSNLSAAYDKPNTELGIKSIQKVANTLQVTLNNHRWRLTDISGDEGFDFDSIYEKYKADNRIPELFDEIIEALQNIVQSGAIDSIRAINELKHIITTLQSARNGSYFATRNAWFFVATWFKNTGWELLGDMPILGAAVRGLRKSLDDMNTGMQSLHEQIYSDIQAQLLKDFPKIDYNSPDIPRLESKPSSDSSEQQD